MAGYVTFDSGQTLNEVIDKLDQMGGPLSYKVVQGLEEVLLDAFRETQALVHVITASLQHSGTTFSDFNGNSKWTGTIRYGGESQWVNDPVDYAIYEQDRGGDHDWMRTLEPEFGPRFEAAMAKWLE